MVHVENSSFDVHDNIESRELFVQDHNGTTMGEVLLFTAQMPFFSFIAISLEMCILNQFGINASKLSLGSFFNTIVIFVLEFVTIILPTILIFTILSDFLTITLLAIILITFLSIMFSVTSPDIFVHYWKLPYSKQDFLTDTIFFGKQPFITYFRSLVFIATTTSILGVDFHIYPRRFAKTETYGVSIMDLGVGLFVVSSALVKNSSVKKHAQGLYKILLESSVFLMLGVFRYLLVHRFNYQQHVSEYGIHWNFFFTLAFVQFFSYLIMKISRGYSFACGITILILHQYLLSSSLENYVLSKVERDEWFSANREGIVSAPGYLSLYLIGIGISNIINPVDTRQTIKNKLRTFVWLISMGVCLFCITYYLNITDCKVSRRLANASYVTWVTALSIYLLLITLMIEILSVCFLPVKPHLKTKLYSLITPAILESINFNGLLFFLLSNVLTGLVNLSVDVFNLDNSRSMFILTTYMALNCAVVFGFYLINIQVKLW